MCGQVMKQVTIQIVHFYMWLDTFYFMYNFWYFHMSDYQYIFLVLQLAFPSVPSTIL